MKKRRLMPAAALGFAIGGSASNRSLETESGAMSARRQIQDSTTLLGEWLHLRVPDPQGGPGQEIFVNLAKRVSYVCPGSSTGAWRRKGE